MKITRKNLIKILLLVAMISIIVALHTFGFTDYLSFEFIKSQQNEFIQYYSTHKISTVLTFSAIYILSTALSIPGAAALTLLAGALFGLWVGFIVVSFSSTIGATLAFLASRFILRETVQNKFSARLQTINQGVQKEGAFYLFSLRLIPIFPFFVINLVMGLTPMRTVTFFFASQLGMVPGTLVYVNAGTQLGQLESLKGILSPSLILSFALLAALPIILKKLLSVLKKRRNTSLHG
jgi:uncharacterized membrane protein YdjX (TVP38/TMEM64 family)